MSDTPQNVKVFSYEFLFSFIPVLHYPAGMRQGDDLAEQLQFPVQLFKVFHVLSLSQADGYVSSDTQVELVPE